MAVTWEPLVRSISNLEKAHPGVPGNIPVRGTQISTLPVQFVNCLPFVAPHKFLAIPAVHLSIIPAISVCLSVCMWPPFLVDRRSDLIETCQEYCRGPADVPFWGLISIGRAVPKLRPFTCQPMTGHGAMTSRMTSQLMFIYLFLHDWRHNSSSSSFGITSQSTLGTWVCAFSRFDIVLHPFQLFPKCFPRVWKLFFFPRFELIVQIIN